MSGKKILLNLQYNKALFQLFVGAKEITSFTEFQSGGDGFRYDLYAFRIAELIIHPKYKFLEKGRKRPDYGIALVRLNYPVYDDESNLGVLKVSTIYSFGPVIFGFVRILIILSDLDPAPETSGSELFCRIRIRIRKRPDPNYFAISGS